MEILEKFEDFRQELRLILRSNHCLISDAECFDDDLLMGLLHQERRILQELEDLIQQIDEDESDVEKTCS